MNKIEFETITKAMVTKQTWVRKSFMDFLEIWADLTEDNIDGHRYFVLFEKKGEYETIEIYLERGDSALKFRGEFTKPDFYFLDPKHSCQEDYAHISIIRKSINTITSGLRYYFKNIQNDSDRLSTVGININNIIKRLS